MKTKVLYSFPTLSSFYLIIFFIFYRLYGTGSNIDINSLSPGFADNNANAGSLYSSAFEIFGSYIIVS
jgi:hypothetical protein